MISFVSARPRALLATGIVIAATLVSAPAAEAGGLPTIAFHVVEPDGTPVLRPIVMVSVFGPTYPKARVLPGAAAGQVVVPYPADDPVASSRLAAGKSVNLLIRVFDKKPGSADINAAYVTAAVGVDAFGVLGELSDVTGQTITLRPGLTDFHPVQMSGTAGPGGGLPHIYTELPDIDDMPDGPPPLCEQTGSGAPEPCYRRDLPDWVAHVNVPIAENHGAGNDVYSAMRYRSTVVTKVGAAVQAGAGGFVEANGAVSYEEEHTDDMSWSNRGPDDNVRAILDSAFLREQSGACYTNYDTGTWQCQVETTYRAADVNGATHADTWRLNDHMDTVQDCWVPLDGVYEPTATSENTSSFSLRLGPDENWSLAAPNQGNLYANTTITQQTHTRKSHIRSWHLTPSRTYSNQYIYVPYGKVFDKPRPMTDGECVRTHLDIAQTASENYNWLNPPPSDTVPAPPSTDDPTDNENESNAPVCGNMPDRCD